MASANARFAFPVKSRSPRWACRSSCISGSGFVTGTARRSVASLTVIAPSRGENEKTQSPIDSASIGPETPRGARWTGSRNRLPGPYDRGLFDALGRCRQTAEVRRSPEILIQVGTVWKGGWGGRIRTSELEIQRLLAYHLPTPHPGRAPPLADEPAIRSRCLARPVSYSFR